MRARATLKWVGLALLGILVAATVAVAASRLASREIGLASEPISAGRELAPKASRPAPAHKDKERGSGGNTTTASPPTSQPPAIAPTSPTHTDNSSGSDSDGDNDDD